MWDGGMACLPAETRLAVCLICVTIFVERCKQTFLSSARVPVTDQSKDTTRVQTGESLSFPGVTFRSMGEGLQDQK